MDSPNIQWASGSAYLEGERGTTAEAVKDIQLAIPTTVIAQENFETDPISGSGGGNLPWLVTTSSPHTGLRCLRSGVITNSQQSLWTFTVPPGAINLRFWHRVSSEQGFDFFEVYVNSVTVPNRVFQLSGTANVWAQLLIPLTGVTSVIFRYVKDSSDSTGLDAAFIDDLEWLSAVVPAIQRYEPLHLDINNNLKVTMMDGLDPVTGFDHYLDCATDSVTVCQTEPFEVELVNNLDCATDSVTVCTDVPIEVEVVNTVQVEQLPLDCTTDSVSACQEGAWNVGVLGTVNVHIIDEPIAVTGSVGINGTVTVVPGRRSLRGVYYASSGALAYTAAADAATGGDLWLVNTSPTVVVYLREVRFTSNLAALALLTALPRINMERMTFTGSPSGAQITAARRDSLDQANTGTIRTANTGMVVTPGATVTSFSPPSSDVVGGLLAANAASAVPVEQLFQGDLDSYIVLRQNQGIVFRQASAGSLTEGRVYNLDIIWEEV